MAGGSSPGPCPAGGVHNHTGSSNYVLALSGALVAGAQSNWRWCNKCMGLTWGGSSTPGLCPAGGTHNLTASGNYMLAQV